MIVIDPNDRRSVAALVLAGEASSWGACHQPQHW
jgi:hypothetical protein